LVSAGEFARLCGGSRAASNRARLSERWAALSLCWCPIGARDPDHEQALLGLLDGRPAFVAPTDATRGKPLYVLTAGVPRSLDAALGAKSLADVFAD